MSLIALDDKELVAINTSISEIMEWQPHKLPYLQIFVKDNSERRVVLNRASTLLASFSQLMTCCIGVMIASPTKQQMCIQPHHITELRQKIWTFLLAEVTCLQPHVKQFLTTELQLVKQRTELMTNDDPIMADKMPTAELANSQIF